MAGEIFALAGTTDRHNQLALGLVVKLWASAREKGCRVFASDMKVRTPSGAFYYPGVMVVCKEDADPLVKMKPCLIVEVLSKSTELVDIAVPSHTETDERLRKFWQRQKHHHRTCVLVTQFAA